MDSPDPYEYGMGDQDFTKLRLELLCRGDEPGK